MMVIISSCLRCCEEGVYKGRKGELRKWGRQKERRGVSVWAVTVGYLRPPLRRAQAALVQVLLVCRVLLPCLSVCLSVSLSYSLQKPEFLYWQVELDLMTSTL